MKKLGIILSVVLVLAAVLTVCAACQTKYDLSYAAWNLGTETAPSIERKMVKAFEDKYNVKIEIKEVGTGNNYEPSINGMIIRDEAPDVFMINNTNYVLKGQHGLDITELAAADADWANIPATLEQPAHYKNGIYAVPFAMNLQGYFINVDLLEDNGLIPKDGNYNWDWFKNAISTLKTAKLESGESVIGLNSEESVYQWYPSALNKNYDHFTWDGSQYHLDSPEFLAGMDEAKNIYNQHLSFESLDETTFKANFEGISGAVDLWNKGRLGIRWGETYEMPNMLEETKGAFEIKFIGIPYVGVSDQYPDARTENFVTVVPDYISIYKGTKNPDLAYQFAKWMTFSPEGITKRIELDKDSGTTNSLPVTTNVQTLEKYFNVFTAVDGVEQMYAKLSDSITECMKIVPGFTRVRYEEKTGYSVTDADGNSIPNANMGEFFDACRQGRFSYAEKASEVNALANKQYADAVKTYENKYN